MGLTALVLVALQIGGVLGGEISDFGYSKGNREDRGQSPAVVLTSPANHQFSLVLHNYCRANELSEESTRNVIELYYDSYLLEEMKAPRYDTYSGYSMGNSLIQSVKPVGATPDVGQPVSITLRYSKVDGSCVERAYKLSGNLYKQFSHKKVDVTQCL